MSPQPQLVVFALTASWFVGEVAYLGSVWKQHEGTTSWCPLVRRQLRPVVSGRAGAYCNEPLSTGLLFGARLFWAFPRSLVFGRRVLRLRRFPTTVCHGEAPIEKRSVWDISANVADIS